MLTTANIIVKTLFFLKCAPPHRLQWLPQLVLLLWPYRNSPKELGLRNRDHSVNDTPRNSDRTVNTAQEIPNQKRSGPILAEVKQKTNQSIKRALLWQFCCSQTAASQVLSQKLVSCTNKLKYKTKVTAPIQNDVAYSRSTAYNLSHISLHLEPLKSKYLTVEKYIYKNVSHRPKESALKFADSSVRKEVVGMI